MEDVEIIKATKAYGYYYATLKDVLTVIEPKMKQAGIWYQHVMENDGSKNNVLITHIYSIANEFDKITSETVINKEATLAGMNRFMIEGSAVTYFRRYHIVTMLGLTTDEDTDAGGKRITEKVSDNNNKQSKGRSVEAASNSQVPDFIKIFEEQSKRKNKDQFVKTFNAYKPQMTDDQIKEVEKILKDKYEN